MKLCKVNSLGLAKQCQIVSNKNVCATIADFQTMSKSAASSGKPSKSAKSETDQREMWLKTTQGLEKAVNKLLQEHESFEKLTAEGLEQIENKRLAAQNTLDSQLLEMESTRKRKMIDLELDLKLKERDGAIEILKKTNEEPILTVVKEQLLERVAQLSASNADAVQAAEDALRKSLTMSHRMEVERIKLTNEKDMAELTQKNISLTERIIEKNQTIEQKTEESVRLQKLVQGVAEASRATFQMPSNNK